MTTLDDWRGDFASATDELLLAGLAATPEQRLDWLEEAVRFAYATGALKAPTRHSSELDFTFELQR